MIEDGVLVRYTLLGANDAIKYNDAIRALHVNCCSSQWWFHSPSFSQYPQS